MNASRISGVLHEIVAINFLHFAVILFVICSLVLVFVSLLTTAPEPGKLKNLTFATIDKKSQALSRNANRVRTDKFMSTIVLLLIGIVWLWFND